MFIISSKDLQGDLEKSLYSFTNRTRKDLAINLIYQKKIILLPPEPPVDGRPRRRRDPLKGAARAHGNASSWVKSPSTQPAPASVRDDVLRVLIADDHPLIREGLRSVAAVAFDNCEVFEASSLDELIALVEQEGDFDLVLLDLQMPGANGFSGLEALRNRFPALPVAVVSAASDQHLMRECIVRGALGFIPKSLKRSAIVEALRLIISGGVFTSEPAPEEADPALADLRERIASLTPQQMRVLDLVAEGLLNKQVAHELGVEIRTVKAHVSAILTKLNISTRTQAAILARRAGVKSAL